MRVPLQCQEEDGRDVARLKGELQALLLAMQERIQGLETVQEQQDSAIQVSNLMRFPVTAGSPRKDYCYSTLYQPLLIFLLWVSEG